MALADTRNAVGSVTRLLVDHLNRRTGLTISAGRPEDVASGASGLNLFLFEVGVDASMRNVPLRDDEPAPLWLSLKYLLTGFDDTADSNTPEAHDMLGRGLSALQEIAILRLDPNVAATVQAALESNPEPLKITFEQTPPDLLNKLMQASEDEYRLSVAFEVRPVLIVPPEPTAYSLLVGVDYTGSAPAEQPDYVGLDVLASLGPVLRRVQPAKFTLGDTVTLAGEDLHLANLSCWLGDAEVGITMQQPDRLTITIPESLGSGTVVSAGEHPLVLRQYLPETNRSRQSNLQIGRLLPIVDTATVGAMTADTSGFLSGSVVIAGRLLGTAEDTVQVALYAEGNAVRTLEIAKTPLGPGDPPDPQQQLTLTLASAHRVRAGTYQVIVAVNGQQARFSPTVTLAP